MSAREGMILRGLTCDGGVRFLAVTLDGPVNEVGRRHGLVADALRLTAEGMVSAALLSAHIKGDERLLLQVQAERPRFALTAELDADGGLRGWVQPSYLPPTPSMAGHLLVIKSDAERELYRGVAAIEGGTFEAAMNHFFAQSLQTLGLVRVAATLDGGDAVSMAGGLLVERMGEGMPEDEFEALVAPLREAPLADALVQLAFGQLLGAPVDLLEQRVVTFRCRCSLAKVESTLISLGAADLRALAAEQGRAEVTCHFCAERYEVPGARLVAMAEDLEGASRR